MFNKQGMVFYLASTILTNGQYPYIYSSAVVKQCVYNRFTNCHTYYLFISGQKPKTYQSSDCFRLEKHFLFNCNIYYDERREFYEECAKLFRNFSDMNEDKNLKNIMSHK